MGAEEWRTFRDAHGTMGDFIEHGYLRTGTPVPSNIPQLDALLCGGFRPGLHVLGGEPGAGKSALGLFVSAMSALSGARVEYLSLEMSGAQCMARLLSLASLWTGAPFRWGDVHELAETAREKLGEVLSDWRGVDLARGDGYRFLVESGDPVAGACAELERKCPGLLVADSERVRDISGIEQELERGRACGLDFAVVDYLQYVCEEGTASEYDKVSSVSKRLNTLAVRLGMPVLALASLSRQGTKGGAPDMHMFKGSGDIEYHALSAMVIDRDPEGSDLERRLHVVKNRFGGVTAPETCVRLRFDGAHNSFELE